MKTRQEMIYEFMQNLSTNPAIFMDWFESEFEMGGYAEHIKSFAEELADTYLRGQ